MQLVEDVPLAGRTTLRVGGPTRFLVEAAGDADVAEALEWAAKHRVTTRVLGGGSNVVVSDAGFPGLVIQIASRGVAIDEAGDSVELHAAAGEPWDDLVALAAGRDWAGLECLSGIPGRVGATPIQNVGAYGQDVSESIVAVRALDRRTLAEVTLSAAECRFAYRDSWLKSGEPDRYVVLGVTYRLAHGGAPRLRYPELARHLETRGLPNPTLAEVRQSVLAVRRQKSMLLDPGDDNTRSCGSFFVNPIVDADTAAEVAQRAGDASMPRFADPGGGVKLAAAWLIERAGFSRGERLGAAGLSTRHTLALVAHDGARASDVVALARRIRARVQEHFGVRLVPEPVFWGFASLDDGLPDDRIA